MIHCQVRLTKSKGCCSLCWCIKPKFAYSGNWKYLNKQEGSQQLQTDYSLLFNFHNDVLLHWCCPLNIQAVSFVLLQLIYLINSLRPQHRLSPFLRSKLWIYIAGRVLNLCADVFLSLRFCNRGLLISPRQMRPFGMSHHVFHRHLNFCLINLVSWYLVHYLITFVMLRS